MDADQRRIALGQIAHAQHHGLLHLASEGAFEAVDAEGSELRGEICLGHFLET